MHIEPSDIEAVRAVLAGEVSLATAASPAYTTVQRVILAHAAFAAAGYEAPAWKGEYGELMNEIALAAAVPADGWRRTRGDERDEDWEWYSNERYRLMPVSRSLELHYADRAGNYLRISSAPEIWDLLSDSALRKAAHDFFKRAAAAVNAGRRSELEQRDRERRFKADVKASSTLKYGLSDSLLYSPSIYECRRIMQELQRLFNLHFGEEPQG